MQVNQNIRFDRFLTDKIDQNKLNCIDCFQLSAAEQLCKEFPQLPVVLVPQQQSRPIRLSSCRCFRCNGISDWTVLPSGLWR